VRDGSACKLAQATPAPYVSWQTNDFALQNLFLLIVSAVVEASRIMSFAYLAATPGLKFNLSLYAVPAGWVVAYVQKPPF